MQQKSSSASRHKGEPRSRVAKQSCSQSKRQKQPHNGNHDYVGRQRERRRTMEVRRHRQRESALQQERKKHQLDAAKANSHSLNDQAARNDFRYKPTEPRDHHPQVETMLRLLGQQM